MGHALTIDYSVANRCIAPKQILDVTILNSANVGYHASRKNHDVVNTQDIYIINKQNDVNL